MNKIFLTATFALGILISAHAQVPANDDFANAELLSGTIASVTNDNEFATTETGEPTSTGNRTIWYAWTAPASGQLTLTTEGSDSFNQYLTVWMGNSVSALKSVVS